MKYIFAALNILENVLDFCGIHQKLPFLSRRRRRQVEWSPPAGSPPVWFCPPMQSAGEEDKDEGSSVLEVMSLP